MPASNSPIGPAEHLPGQLKEAAADIIERWHAGIDLSVEQLRVLADLMLENRVSIMVSSYETDRRVA